MLKQCVSGSGQLSPLALKRWTTLMTAPLDFRNTAAVFDAFTCSSSRYGLFRHYYQRKYDLVVYDDGGEPYAPAYLIPYGEGKLKVAPRLVLSTGGTAKGNAYTQVDSWYKAIEFLKE